MMRLLIAILATLALTFVGCSDGNSPADSGSLSEGSSDIYTGIDSDISDGGADVVGAVDGVESDTSDGGISDSSSDGGAG